MPVNYTLTESARELSIKVFSIKLSTYTLMEYSLFLLLPQIALNCYFRPRMSSCRISDSLRE